MAFHIDVSHLPSIQTYANAKRIFEESKAVRGGSQSVKRIGRKYDNTKWLRQDMVDGVEIYVAGLHNTDLVSFYPTHYEISLRGWSTTSTLLFVEKITGCYIYTISASKLAPKHMQGMQEADFRYGDVPITANHRYKFDYNHRPLEPEKHPKVYKYKIDRKAMNQVRDRYRPFINYVKAMSKIDRGEVNPTILRQPIVSDEAIADMMLDESKHAQVYEMLRSWEARHSYEMHTWRRVWTVSEKHMLERIDKIVKGLHAHEVVQSEIVS